MSPLANKCNDCLREVKYETERKEENDSNWLVVVYFILSRLLYLAFSANLGLLCMPHPGMGPLV